MAGIVTTTCCISGGGPAGLMLGYLLARAGVDVVVLEKHADFLRDFRGDTIHPSTMQVMDELGLLDAFLQLPHQRVSTLSLTFGNETLPMADFSKLSVRAPFIAMMPQWDFLNFIAARASALPHFKLLMSTEATGLLRDGEAAAGVKAKGAGGEFEIRARLVIAADGRTSNLRAASGLEVEDLGSPIDVLWFRLSRRPQDGDQAQARFEGGHIMITINRGEYWQCAFVIEKGGMERLRAAGLPAFRELLAPLTPYMRERAGEILSWDQVKLLSVQVNRLRKWWLPGFLCIGDAAHAMSPVGGVGVNLAVQDAVAAANILASPLLAGEVSDRELAKVQARRDWPTRVTQSLQMMIQKQVLQTALAQKGTFKPPLALRFIAATPLFRALPARLVGLGIRQEHVGEGLR